ncbi:hypothetical protein [Dankookia sp. P2]|uniref:hypothetical protein n=1 Tax=Dankookia sp. P2 TaxID=3423955 RepID=UPI003D66B504
MPLIQPAERQAGAADQAQGPGERHRPRRFDPPAAAPQGPAQRRAQQPGLAERDDRASREGAFHILGRGRFGDAGQAQAQGGQEVGQGGAGRSRAGHENGGGPRGGRRGMRGSA